MTRAQAEGFRPMVWDFTEAQYELERESRHGHCLACGEIEIPFCPPELQKGVCPCCGEPRVYGMVSLHTMGRINVEWES